MVKKLQKLSAEKKPGAQLSGTVKDSAQQIWLAGLGAFAKAQEEGNKVFDALVKQGLSIQRKTQVAAEEKITEATSKMTSMATGIGSKAVGQWDKLESIFEERVAKALGKLGVPTAKDIAALNARIDALSKKAPAAAKPVAKTAPAKPKAAAKPAAKAAKPAQPAAKRKVTKPAIPSAAPADDTNKAE